MPKRKHNHDDPELLGMPEARKLWQNEDLLSAHYLNARVSKNDWWPTDEMVRPTWEFCRDLYNKRYLALAKNNEAFTRQELIDKVLERLGFAWTDNLSLPDQDAEPDYILFGSETEKEAVIEKDTATRYRAAVSILEAKKLNHPLSQISQHQQRYPHQQISDYLQDAQVLSWGILTNGNEWRLYCREAPRQDFFGLNFEVAIKSLDKFKLFVALFSPQAFQRDPQGKCRLDFVREQSVSAQSELEQDLRQRIFTILTDLANGFASRQENQIPDTEEGRKTLYENCLIYLYRLLFILYAEGRGLLPVAPRTRRYYKELSLARLQPGLKNFTSYDSKTRTRLGEDISELFHVVNGTDEAKNKEYSVARYNGGLFNPGEHPLLENWRIADTDAADVLRGLMFDPPPKPNEQSLPVQTVDFGDLRVQHLGSIYEGLLEHHFVRRADGRLELTTDKAERKATGTYYTPDYIVSYIVEQTLLPLVDEIEKSDPVIAARAAGRQDDSFSKGVLGLNICDPAMGSGHFLVEATRFLAEQIVYHPTTKFKAKIIKGISQEDAEIAYWRRLVVEGCIYGVDLNPLAVELAKLSLWLTTVASDQPLNFLDHHLRCGNSLIGARLEVLSQVPEKKHKSSEGLKLSWRITENLRAALTKAVQMVIHDIEDKPSASVNDVKNKEKLWLQSVRPALLPFRTVANLWTASFYGNELRQTDYEALIELLDIHPDKIRPWQTPAELETIVMQAVVKDSFKLAGRELDKNQRKHLCAFLGRSERRAGERRFFHWELEFPEVFFNEDGTPRERAGFDAVIGNPPYGIVFDQNDKELFTSTFPSFIRNNDLYVAFSEFVVSLTRLEGLSSLIVPNTFILGPYFKGLRRCLKERANILAVVDFGTTQIFSDPNVFNAIFLCARRPAGAWTAHTRTKLCRGTVSKSGVQIVSTNEIETRALDDDRWKADHPIIAKMRANGGLTLGMIAWVKDVGFNYWTVGRGKKRGGSIGSRVLYDGDRQNAGDLPYLKGADFSRYTPVESNEHWIRQNWRTLLEPDVDIFGFSAELLSTPVKIVYRQTADELIASIDTNGRLVDKTVHIILLRDEYRKLSYNYVLAIFNSLLANFAYRDFAQEQGRAFAQVKTFNVKRLPIRRIEFTTPEKQKTALLEKAKRVYESGLASGRSDGLVAFATDQLAANPERADVVHDLLGFLGEQMMGLNREKRAAAKQFQNDLKDFDGIEIRSLKPKTKLDEFWKLEVSEVFAHFRANNVRLKIPDGDAIRARFQNAKDLVLPMEAQIAFTDTLIDQIVYRLYGLTPEEIKAVEDFIAC
jgi:hypothetical protein